MGDQDYINYMSEEYESLMTQYAILNLDIFFIEMLFLDFHKLIFYKPLLLKKCGHSQDNNFI